MKNDEVIPRLLSAAEPVYSVCPAAIRKRRRLLSDNQSDCHVVKGAEGQGELQLLDSVKIHQREGMKCINVTVLITDNMQCFDLNELLE